MTSNNLTDKNQQPTIPMKIKLFAFNKDNVTGVSIRVPDEIEEELEGKQDDDLFKSFWVIEEVASRFDLPLFEVNPISFDLTLYREVSA